MSCVVSVAGICSSDDRLKISPSQNVQTPANDKHVGHGDPCLILQFLICFNTTALLVIRIRSTRICRENGVFIFLYS